MKLPVNTTQLHAGSLTTGGGQLDVLLPLGSAASLSDETEKEVMEVTEYFFLFL